MLINPGLPPDVHLARRTSLSQLSHSYLLHLFSNVFIIYTFYILKKLYIEYHRYILIQSQSQMEKLYFSPWLISLCSLLAGAGVAISGPPGPPGPPGPKGL